MRYSWSRSAGAGRTCEVAECVFHVEHKPGRAGVEDTDILKNGAAELGVPLTKEAVTAFGAYLSELVKWNARINLTAIDSPRDIIIKHFLDSIMLCRMLPAGPFSAVDVGAGAGFPGLPIKIVRPDMTLTLVEPARKKAVFLRQVTRQIGLGGVTVSGERVEAFALNHPEGFEVVLSRAFRDPDRLLGLVGPLLATDGSVAVSLGPEWDGRPPAGWLVAREETATLPYSGIDRRLVVFKRAG